MGRQRKKFYQHPLELRPGALKRTKDRLDKEKTIEVGRTLALKLAIRKQTYNSILF